MKFPPVIYFKTSAFVVIQKSGFLTESHHSLFFEGYLFVDISSVLIIRFHSQNTL